MELSFKDKTIKYSVYALIILAAAFLQNIAGAWFSVFGARCFFLIPVCVLIGAGEDERAAAFLGMFGGILWDMISSNHRVFASIFLTVACYITSWLVTFLFRNTYRYGIIASGCTAFLFIILYWLLLIVPRGGDGRLAALGFFYLPSFVYTVLMSFVLYLFIRPLKAKLNRTDTAVS